MLPALFPLAAPVYHRRGEGARRLGAPGGGRTTGMIILRILANAVIMAGEVAAVAALAAFAFYYPFVFAGVTAALSFVLGLRLEVARLRYELPFYFGGLVKRGTFLTALVGTFEALFKGVLAGVAALFTFAGTNPDRLFWVAVAVRGVRLRRRRRAAAAVDPRRRAADALGLFPPGAAARAAVLGRAGAARRRGRSCRRQTSPTSAGTSSSTRRPSRRSSR